MESLIGPKITVKEKCKKTFAYKIIRNATKRHLFLTVISLHFLVSIQIIDINSGLSPHQKLLGKLLLKFCCSFFFVCLFVCLFSVMRVTENTKDSHDKVRLILLYDLIIPNYQYP